jgi:hypothetical protein
MHMHRINGIEIACKRVQMCRYSTGGDANPSTILDKGCVCLRAIVCVTTCVDGLGCMCVASVGLNYASHQ